MDNKKHKFHGVVAPRFNAPVLVTPEPACGYRVEDLISHCWRIIVLLPLQIIVMRVKQYHKPSPKFTIFIGGMFTISKWGGLWLF